MAWQNYKQLTVWNKAMQLTDAVYDLIELLPKEENFALSSQLRRAVVSIPSNIAEGNGRNSALEFKQFLSVARGSVFEVETQLLVCVRRCYFSESDAAAAFLLCDEIGRMITGFILYLDEKLKNTAPHVKTVSKSRTQKSESTQNAKNQTLKTKN